MLCPHHDIKIVQRSKRQSAVAAAAYQSGERLFSEYDQKQKYYSHKNEIVHTEIMLPPHAPPEYADRNTLWNAAEAVEKQWNSQLARRSCLPYRGKFPRTARRPDPGLLPGVFCFQRHDCRLCHPRQGGRQPHAHILLTMRAMDEHREMAPQEPEGVRP